MEAWKWPLIVLAAGIAAALIIEAFARRNGKK